MRFSPSSVRLKLVTLTLGAIAVGAPSLHAQYFGRNKVQYADLEFRVLETEHFDIYYYPEERDAVLHAARLAERRYAHLLRLLDHAFGDRQPLILYASHPHFTQTNVVAGRIGETTGGFTDSARRRIVMPFAAGLAATDHVLGHELAHAFQFDIARRASRPVVGLPLWFVEGMAEYLARGPIDPHTAMWMRDAAAEGDLPAIEDLRQARYFPYRYGHALWAYLAGRFGDEVIGKILRAGPAHNAIARIERVTGVDAATLSRQWHESIRGAYPPSSAATHGNSDRSKALVTSPHAGRLNLAPALSPDGKLLIFLSERDRLSIEVFLADATSGTVLGKLVETATDPHFDSLQFIDSAGAWDTTGRRFALAALHRGAPILTIIDVRRQTAEREIRLNDLDAIFNPAWSPDGRQIAFSALKGGFSDLYLYDLETGGLRQVTRDPFADLQPAWSPDGKWLAFATDRFSTTIPDLRLGAYRLARLELATGTVQPLAGFDGAKHIDPHWSPDGASLYFLCNRDQITNVYRLNVGSGELFQVTNVPTGVTGITEASPALSVAAGAPAMAFTVYRKGRYAIHRLDTAESLAGRAVASVATAEAPEPSAAAATPPVLGPSSGEDGFGSTVGDGFTVRRYKPGLSLDAISQPYLAVGGSGAGRFFRAGVSFSFRDMLGDHQLHTAVQVGAELEDFAARAAYLNRRSRWNWGGFVGQIPVTLHGVVGTPTRAIPDQGIVIKDSTLVHQVHRQIGGVAAYPFSRAQRLEIAAGLRSTTFTQETRTRVFALSNARLVREEEHESPLGDRLNLFEASAAIVYDTAIHGPTSPLFGRRYRFEIATAGGSIASSTITGDYRQYAMPLRPYTVAMRLKHVGRYGPGADDPRLMPLLFGLRDLVRGYELRSFVAGRCRATGQGPCSMLDELAGTRLLVANLELRVPLVGIFTRNLDYGPLPVETFVFSDAALLWKKRGGAAAGAQDLLRSMGAGFRANAAGMIVELDVMRPLDRAAKGWTFAVNLRPGF